MTKALYVSADDSFLKGEIDLLTDTIYAQLINVAEYTFDEDHQFLSSVPEIARVGSPVALTNPIVEFRYFDADDVTFPALTGDPVGAIILYRAGASDAERRLILYDDEASGLPYTPSGVDARISWDTYIFRRV